ncbi:MAG: response regulator [Anaerolineae bacterium]
MLYLTPAAIGYLTQLILSALISGYFLVALRRQPVAHLRWLSGAFTAITAFIATLFLEAALLPPAPVLIVVFLQIPLLSVAWVCLLQFAYHYPALCTALCREARLTLFASGLYALWETGFAVYRFVRLRAGVVEYRIDWTDYLLLLLLLWLPVVFVRQMYRLAPSHERFWVRLRAAWLHPVGREGRALRTFTLIFLFVASLSLFNLLRTFYLMPVALVNVIISLGILIALFVFALAYLDQRPETTSFIVKLSGVTLTAVLAILGIVGWVVAPAHIATYQPDLITPRALRFTPATEGGYTIDEAPYAFEVDVGRDLQLDDGLYRGCSEALDFAFPFYGETFPALYACNDGVIALGQAIRYREFQYHYGAGVPLLMPLLIDLDPNISSGGVFVRQEADRLIVTWERLRGFRLTEAEFTFQAVLYTDGRFDFVYAALPEIIYRPNDDPGASLWAVGAIPGYLPGGPRGSLPSKHSLMTLPVAAGPEGVVQDFLLEFRQHLHRMLAPLGGLILAASLFITAGFPWLFHVSLVRPLNALVEGVEHLEAGEYEIGVPVHHADEIGFLTRAFNDLAGQLGDLIHNLEARVRGRTAALDAANAQLRAEITEREQAQATVIEQQRTLATYEERERLGRELHDGLGQTLGYINVQSQAVQTLLDKDQIPAAQSNLTDLIEAAQQAHGDVRAHIMGLRRREQESEDFLTTVRGHVTQLGRRWNLACSLSVPEGFPTDPFTPAVAQQALHILQEALANVRKHASADHVEIIARVIGAYVQLVIVDDGRGFDASEGGEAEAGHFGLRIMRERAEQVGGQLEIRSRPGKGTRVTATLPRFVPTQTAADKPDAIQGLRVLLADDHPLFLDGLRNLLMARGVTVVGTAHNGREAIAKARALHPDVAVLDLNMPECDGLEATRAIKAELPEIKVVILTVSEDEQHLFEAIKNGASGYLLKNLDANAFCSLLMGLMQGEAALAPGMAERLMAEFARPTEDIDVPPEEPLTLRQREVLRLVAQGLTYKGIGLRLHLSESTIKYHMGEILAKLHLQNRAQAIAYLKEQET